MVKLYSNMTPVLLHNSQLDLRKVRTLHLNTIHLITFCKVELVYDLIKYVTVHAFVEIIKASAITAYKSKILFFNF